jgi:hypothetical protein
MHSTSNGVAAFPCRAFVVAVGAGLVLLAAVPTIRADGPEPFKCSDQTLHGDYGFSIDGTLTLPPPAPNPLLRGLAMQRFDGRGGLRQVDFITLNGAPEADEWRPATGTYHVNPDCTGTMQLDFEDGRPPLNLRLVVVDRGRQVMTIVEGLATGSHGTRVR